MHTYEYTVVENRTTGQDAIKLVEDPFVGIVVAYHNVKVNQTESGIDLFFDYEILDNANKEFGSMEPFELYIGTVLRRIIIEHAMSEASQHDNS